MATDLGELVYTLTLNDEGFAEQTDAAAGSMDALGASGEDAAVGVDAAGASTTDAGAAAADASGGFDLFGGSMLKSIAPLAALFVGFEGLKSIFTEVKTNTDLWNNSVAQINNTLSQTHDAVGLNVDQLESLAKTNSAGLPIAAAANLAAEQQLLNYKLAPDVYKKASDSIDNIATAMANAQGQAVPSSEQISQAAKKLGLALQDPTTGINQLSKAGIKLTADQQDQVKALQKSGDVVGAQTQLMNDFAAATAGKAAASTETFQGKVDLLKTSIAEKLGPAMQTGEADAGKIGVALFDVGSKIIAYLKPAFDGLVNALEKAKPAFDIIMNAIKPIVEIVGGAIVVAFKLWVEYITDVVKIGTTLIEFLDKHKVLLAVIAGVIVGTLVPSLYMWAAGVWLQAPGWLAAEAGAIAAGAAGLLAALPWIAIAAVVALAAYEVVTHWKDVKQWFHDFIKDVKDVFRDGIDFIKQHWALIVDILLGPLGIVITQIIEHWSDIKQGFSDVVSAIEDIWNGIIGFFSAVWGGIKAVFDTVVGWIKDIFKAEYNGVMVIWNGITGFFSGLWNGIKAVFNTVKGWVVDFFRNEYNGIMNIWNGITGFFSGLWGGIKSTVGQIGTVLSGAFKDAFNAVIGLWDDTMGKIFHGQKISVGPVHFDLPDLNIPKMASGGIVDSATLALIGESGPEAVVPLNSKNSPMGGNTYNIAQVTLSTADAVDEFFNIGNRNTALELQGGAPLAGTAGV